MKITRLFAIGFFIGLLIFIGLNLLAAHRMSDCGLAAVFQLDSCNDDIARAGFPLQFYEEGGFDFRFTFNALALAIDVGIGLAISAVLGWLFVRVRNP